MDSDKVIKGLEVCTSIADGESCPKDCPYYQEVCYGYDQLMRDALKMLKEQEEVVHCKDCKFFIGEGHYCKIRGMGRALKEDDFCSDGRSVKLDDD